jgi:flagellar transcriptional activator FlhD
LPIQVRLIEVQNRFIAAQIAVYTQEPNMTDEQLSTEIRDANLTYLMLAQNMIRKDKTEALFRLGISEESATLVAALSAAQILKISSGNMLLCNFRVTDDIVWNLLTNHTPSKVDNDATTKLHASILMAGRFAEAI